MRLLVHGALAVDAEGVRDDAWVLCSEGRIEDVGTGSTWPRGAGNEEVDATGLTLVPGFLDLHAHGGGGFGYDGGDVLAGLAAHRRHGTAASLVSLASASMPVLAEQLRRIGALAAGHPEILGVHVEGPFLSPARRGAHDPEALVPPTAEHVDRLLEAGGGVLRMVTIAPELPGALDAISRLSAAGVVVAVGHTEADYRLTREAFERGARVLTHTFNAMPGIAAREPGPVLAAADDDRVTLELILDGIHVSAAAARMLFELAPGRVALVTDAMAAAAAGDGSYRLGSLDVTVDGGRAVVVGTGTLAGSTLTQDAAVRRAVLELGLEPAVAVAAATSAPAAALGLAHRGSLRPGAAADLVLLDEEWRVARVISGR
ncbi:N-acetylglucosamine-6-phosphate deacetylase [Naasia sp. SYSU D00948]|uniref:N-acetylglucosamine-6-phosphate deacetylase n=1 Tax=Naasia sp. SYSU D00948 TaxID=2817379 RepID=UPI001B30BFD5|nr:N-acetylglucosamine-6-phosphate deacetylase [Naasia sp. SYSU D00948]